MQVTAALYQAPLARLRGLRHDILPELKKLLEDLHDRYSPLSNWKGIRECVQRAKSPVIPYLGANPLCNTFFFFCKWWFTANAL